jgi:ribosomal protein L25, Ctc-form
MSALFELNAEVRRETGKGASRRLRRANKALAILYGGGKEPLPLMVDQNELLKHLDHEAFYSHVLKINIGDQTERAVLKALQRHSTRREILHFDLQRISKSEKLRLHVPLHFVGADKAPGIRDQGGALSHHMVDVEITCLPQDLPEYIEVDVSRLHTGESLRLSDLTLPQGAELVALSPGSSDATVASIHKARAAEAVEDKEGEVQESPESSI